MRNRVDMAQTKNCESSTSVHAIVRRFSVGERIRINFWVDRRESCWRYGTVTGEPVNYYGTIAQKVQWDAGYESIMANSLFERV